MSEFNFELGSSVHVKTLPNASLVTQESWVMMPTWWLKHWYHTVSCVEGYRWHALTQCKPKHWANMLCNYKLWFYNHGCKLQLFQHTSLNKSEGDLCVILNVPTLDLSPESARPLVLMKVIWKQVPRRALNTNDEHLNPNQTSSLSLQINPSTSPSV